MKMPDEIAPAMFAPCGMNCMVCYKHCYHKKPCPGCLAGDAGKPEHCRKCRIKDCVRDRGLAYCFQCPEFPCRDIRSLEKSYTARYRVSLVQSSLTAKEQGIDALMALQRESYTCPECGGVVSLHDAECSECHRKYS